MPYCPAVMALRENYKPWIYVEIIHLGLFMDSMTNDKSISSMKSLKMLLTDWKTAFYLQNYMLHADFSSPFPLSKTIFPIYPRDTSYTFSYMVVNFNVCLTIPITFLFYWIIQNFEQSFYKFINFLSVCLVNKRMNDWWVNIFYSDYDQIQRS